MRIVALGLVALGVAASACSDSNPSGPDSLANTPAGLVVSEPHAGLSASIQMSGTASLSEAASAYVSALPGTFPRGLTVTLRNKTRGGSAIVVELLDGGFDPVSIPAYSGDEVS